MNCKVFYALFVLILQFFKVSSHSWLACVDYTEKNGAIWNPEKCRGFARDSQIYARKDSFGFDRGELQIAIFSQQFCFSPFQIAIMTFMFIQSSKKN